MSQTTTEERKSALDQFAEMKEDEHASGTMPAVVEPHTLAVLSRSEIDAQTAMAAAHPRSIKAFRQMLRDLVLLNPEVAADQFYTLPGRRRRDGTTGDDIEGPSVRFTENMTYAWSNARIGARVIEEAHDHVTAQGIFNDLQTNVVTTFEVQRRIMDSRGRRYSLDMIGVTANAACSIARRNAILQAIPKPLWQDIYNAARALAAGSGEDLTTRRDSAVDAFIRMGVSVERILAKLGVTDRSGIGLDELTRLRGFYTAIRDGETTVEDVFSVEKTKPEQTSSSLDQFASGKGQDRAVSDPEPANGGEASPPVPSTELPPEANEKTMVSGGPLGGSRDYRECIDKLLQVAVDKELDESTKLGVLESSVSLWTDRLGDEHFVTQLANNAAKVATGRMKAADARRQAEAQVP